MPCEHRCPLCECDKPLSPLTLKSESGVEMESVRPACHPNAVFGPFVPYVSTLIEQSASPMS